MRKMLVVDLSRCTGCEACVDACSSRRIGAYAENASMVRLRKDEARTVFVPLLCEHCGPHPCVDVCPEEAIRYDEEAGDFTVDEERCTACGACAEICPFQGIFVTEKSALKCDLCRGEPLCVKVCYPKALNWIEVTEGAMMDDLRGKERKLRELRGEHED
jgi:anaerobic carbon-monoxide dehydrogenase iron sulfur subunit